jgi:hypothetical protein
MELVCGLEHEWFIFPIILGIVISTDELIFFRGVGQPPTRETFHGILMGDILKI